MCPDPETGETHPNLQSLNQKVGRLEAQLEAQTRQLEALAAAVSRLAPKAGS